MNKNDKDWLFQKIKPLRIIMNGIKKTLEITDLHIYNEMSDFLEIFIKEIHNKIGVKQK